MLLSNKLVTLGLLLLVALAIICAEVQSKSAIEKGQKAIKKYVQRAAGKVIGKRAADEKADEAAEAPAKKSKRAKKATTVAPKPGDTAATTTTAAAATTPKAASKKHAKTAKKAIDKALDTEAKTTAKPIATTKAPGGAAALLSTTKPLTTKKPGEKGATTTTTASPDAKELDAALKSIGTIRANKKVPKSDSRMKVANEKWLQNQEKLAIEHMIAGVDDWIKVLQQTSGKTYNKAAAGEFFDKVNNKLIKKLRNSDKPRRLISHYRSSRLDPFA